jgi:hypothetical protein
LWEGIPPQFWVVANENKCVVVIELGRPSPKFRLIEFVLLRGYRVESFCDENVIAHPLRKHGLRWCRAFVVENSPWAAELAAIERAAPSFRENVKREPVHHYLLMLKDRSFEALATGLRVVADEPSREAALGRASAIVFGP